MIKRMFFLTIALFSVFQVIAKTSPEKDMTENEPQEEVKLHSPRDQQDITKKAEDKKSRRPNTISEEKP